MSEGERYPRTGTYRANRNTIDQYASSTDEQLDEEDAQAMLGLTAKAYEDLSSSERQDIDNFITYATKRLAAGALASKLGRRATEEGSEGFAFHNLAPQSMAAHDLIHSIIAYGRTNGKSLIPAYMDVSSFDEQLTDHVAIQEEMIVDLLDQGGSSAIIQILAGVNPRSVSVYGHRGRTANYLESLDRIEPLRESDPKAYALAAFEAFYKAAYRPLPDGRDRHLIPAFDQALAYIAEHRDPEYVRIFTEKWEAGQKGEQSPRYGYDTFVRVTAPLLERLRHNPNAE